MISAWVTLGGGWSKFKVQRQQTAAVLRWRTLSAPALWVFLWENPPRCLLLKCTRVENEVLLWFLLLQTDLTAITANFVSVWSQAVDLMELYILSFSITNSIKMWNGFQKMGSTSAKNLWLFFSKGSLHYTVVTLELNYNDRSYCLTQLLPQPVPVSGPSWSSRMLKDYKN